MAELPKIPCPECGQIFDAMVYRTHRCKPLPITTLREHVTKIMARAREAEKLKADAEYDDAALELGRFILKYERVMGPIITPDLSHLIITAQKIRRILGGWNNETIRAINMHVDVKLSPRDLMQFVRFSEALALIKEQIGWELMAWEQELVKAHKDKAA